MRQNLFLHRSEITTVLKVAVASWFYSASAPQSNLGKVGTSCKNIGSLCLKVAESGV